MSYDVIVVGARLAGSGTALLLARSGARVLVVDQARFPSDTLSTHQLQVPGVARLHRWGLLERVSRPAYRRRGGCASTPSAAPSSIPDRRRWTASM